MKQKLSLFGLILVGALVLAGAALADDPKAEVSQPKEPVAGSGPSPSSQGRPRPDQGTHSQPNPRQRGPGG